MSARPDQPSLDEAEVIARHHANLNPWMVTFLARYDRLTAVAEAARELHDAQFFSRPEDPEWIALGAALSALDGDDQ